MVRGEEVTSRNCVESITESIEKGGGMNEPFIKELSSAMERLNHRLMTKDFPEGVRFYEYPVKRNGRFLRLGVEIESGKFYLQGDGIDGKPKAILL
jgi:hypothetical protein